MTNMYQVIDTKTKKAVDTGFKNRELAKVVRNELNEKNNSDVEGSGKPRFVVSRGTDHPRGPSDGVGKLFRKKRR